MSKAKKILCIIYCRVSSKRQVEEGHGLDAQELKCRAFAKLKGYEIAAVYFDEGVSGSFLERKGMQEVLDKLHDIPSDTEVVVLVDDLDRFSRDVRVHIELKEKIKQRGGHLECTTFEFIEDDPMNEFVEIMFAAKGQMERKTNRLRVLSRMKARLENGYWCFSATPPGYKMSKSKIHGKIPLIVNDKAAVVTEGLEGYADFRFHNQADLARFFRKNNLHGDRRVNDEDAARVLKRSLFYAGWLEYKEWDVKPVRAHHKQLISFETHTKIQERLLRRDKRRPRKNDNPEFPLRRFVLCRECGHPLTGGGVMGNGGRYAQYWCANKKSDCKYYGKTIRKREIEDKLIELLIKVKPTPETIKLAKLILLEKWDEKINQVSKHHEQITRSITDMGKQVDDLLTRAADTRNATAATAYENKVEKLEQEKIVLTEKLNNFEADNFDFRTALEKVINFLENPAQTWQKGDLKNRHRILQMCFSKQLEYDRDRGFRTADLSVTYAIISGNSAPELAQCGHGGN